MDKEEQIKRLAQNLFNNGFTKSMDYAIQTAANMLGFENTGGQQEPQMYSRDQARKLSQDMAQERVYKQIPSNVMSAVQTPSPQPVKQIQQEPSMYDQSSYYNGDAIMYDATAPQREPLQEEPVEKPSLSLDYSASEVVQPTPDEPEESLDFTSQEHIHDSPREYEADENFIEKEEDTSHLELQSEFQEEEQTSLMSGYLNTYKGEESKESPQRVEGDTISEDIFDSSFSQESRFPREYESSEDFFTPALEEKQVQPQAMQQPQTNLQEVHQQSAQPAAEAQVDITQMFNYRNLQNH
jgi:hypothetical protein